MRTSALLVMMVSIAWVGWAMAAPPTVSAKGSKADASTKAMKPAKLSCEEFLAVDEVTRPAIVYWAEGVNSKGKPEDAVVDVERTNRLVPVLIEECKTEPKASFWTKVKVELKKVF